MLRQYSPQRFRYETIRNTWHAVGTVPVGTIFRSADAGRYPYKQRKLIVEAWHPREIGAAARVNGKYENRFAARGGHLATATEPTEQGLQFVMPGCERRQDRKAGQLDFWR